MSNSIYKTIITAKNGRNIPVLTNDRTIESKYNPEREATTILSTIQGSYTFFIVLGISSGSIIEALLETYNNCKVIGIETSQDDINFLLQLDSIKSLMKNQNVILTSLDNIQEVLINNYVPALYGNFKIIEQKPWLQFNNAILPLLNQKINKAIGIISADYSVQCHFGKIWQNNIINNLRILSTLPKYNYPSIKNTKTAIIVAAGPSLDDNINDIKDNISDYFIIATDTAYQALYKHNIEADIVISIDGQHISHNHFMGIPESTKTIFALDLCSDYSISEYLKNKKLPIFYFKSGHPLSNYASSFSKIPIIELFSGAGTVTITALDLALKLGFSKIKIYGGDFSYIKGKAYVRGTYFDYLFGKENNKLSTLENFYDKLIYRTELIKQPNDKYSTVILNAYRDSLELYLSNNSCSFDRIENSYVITVNNSNQIKYSLEAPTFDYRAFIADIKNSSTEGLIVPLLPYIAWLRNKNHEQEDFVTLLKLAQSNIVIYN